MSEIQLGAVNLNLLLALDALLEQRSVTEAARRQGVTPSAMSHALRQLRELVDDPLLVRTRGGFVRSPRAERIWPSLHRALVDVQRAIRDADAFDAASARRSFVIAAPDFVSTILLAEIAREIGDTAPGIDFEVRPSERRGNAARLESGEIDLALGAVIDDMPGVRRMDLYPERFACAVRAGHPAAAGWGLDAYCAHPHVLITLSDHTSRDPTWVDEALARDGRARRVTWRTRSFLSAPMLVADSDAVITGPHTLLVWLARRFPLDVLPSPIALPTYHEQALWHERFDLDPGHLWLRDRLARAGARIAATVGG